MGSVLKLLFCILLALVMLVFILPLLWIVIKEAGGLFGGMFASVVGSGDLGYIIFTIVCIIFIIWALATWNN
jgi:hypothetical protein